MSEEPSVLVAAPLAKEEQADDTAAVAQAMSWRREADLRDTFKRSRETAKAVKALEERLGKLETASPQTTPGGDVVERLGRIEETLLLNAKLADRVEHLARSLELERRMGDMPQPPGWKRRGMIRRLFEKERPADVGQWLDVTQAELDGRDAPGGSNG